MNQAQLEQEVAGRTGESIRTVRRRGFHLMEPIPPRPLVVDWDDIEGNRMGLFPMRPPRKVAIA